MPIEITIPKIELYDEAANKFVVDQPEVVIEVEHSLVSISIWEAKFEKPFLNAPTMSDAEVIAYIKCMAKDQKIPDSVFDRITKDGAGQVAKYITAKMSATSFAELPGQKAPAKQTITSEMIYHWMVSHNIPSEYQHWHLNRLITLIRVCNDANAPKKKMSTSDVYARNRALNAKRRAESGSRG